MTVASPAPAESPPRPGPTRHLISVGEYFRMGEAAILAPDARYELIEGEIIDIPLIGPPHAGRTNRLTAILSEAVNKRAIVSAQNPIILGDFSAPQPDVAVLRYRDDYYERSHPTAPDVLLLIEVADTSLAYDRGTKLTLYARYRIPEVWIVDIPGGHLDIHRDPDGARYTRQFRASDLSKVETLGLPDLILDLGGLF